jgi:hypothetical protein
MPTSMKDFPEENPRSYTKVESVELVCRKLCYLNPDVCLRIFSYFERPLPAI